MNSDSTMEALPTLDQNMNADSSMMTFPTRDQFVASYFRQYFSLPDSIIYYILKNPASSKIYQKLIQCCKYFFIKNPILVFHCLKIDDDGWKICFENDCDTENFAKKFNINIKTLSGCCKLWIQDRLHIFSSDSKHASDLISHISQCDAEKLFFYDQVISLQQLLFCSQCAKKVSLRRVIVKSDAYSEMPVDEIVAILPNAERFMFEFGVDSRNVSSDTVKKLFQIPHFKNLQKFHLYKISEEFDIRLFYNYYKNSITKFSFAITYQNLMSEDYEEMLEGFNNEILDAGISDRVTSAIVFPGQDATQKNALIEMFKTSRQLYNKL